ncbi:MAG: hypothetical protein FWD44_00515 [Oscillospiraceae bacterium]|nr:hypothetical protein [Oscillospiraceae bacterium]
MKQLTRLIKCIKSIKGESIMEVLVAMLVFTISLTAITLIIKISTNLTATQLIQAREAQGLVNNIMADVYEDAAGNEIGVVFPLMFRQIEIDDDGNVEYVTDNPIVAGHDVRFLNENGIAAFMPNTTP